MEYKGKLYGKISNQYFFTGRTSEEWDEMVAKINEIESQLIKYQESTIEDCRNEINEEVKRGDLIRIVRSFCLNKDYTISREDIPEMVDKIINRIN